VIAQPSIPTDPGRTCPSASVDASSHRTRIHVRYRSDPLDTRSRGQGSSTNETRCPLCAEPAWAAEA
jgi:hypothetical protein